MTPKSSDTDSNGTTTGAFARTVEQARSGLHSAVDKASGAARPAVDQLAESAHQITATLAGAATQAAETLRTRGGQLREAPARITESCRGQVRESPLAALGIALAAGIAVGWAVLR